MYIHFYVVKQLYVVCLCEIHVDSLIKVEYMLSEWVRYYHQPGMFKEGDKIYAAYVARVTVYIEVYKVPLVIIMS